MAIPGVLKDFIRKQEKIKKLYKTKNGILTFLDNQMGNWTEKHIKIK